MSPQITHIIYDVDGLLLDTEPFYTKAHQILAARYGKVFDWSVKSKMIGLRAHDSAAVMINALGLPITKVRVRYVHEPKKGLNNADRYWRNFFRKRSLCRERSA